MPKVFNIDSQESASNQAQQRDAAREIYCTMKVVRFATIATRVGLPKHVLTEWAQKEDWAGLRDQRQKSEVQELIDRIGDPSEHEQEIIEICKLILSKVKSRLQNNGDGMVDTLLAYTNIVQKVADTQRTAYKRLSIR